MRYKYIYMYVEGHVAELVPPHTQCLGFKGEKFKLRESWKKCSSYGVSSIL